MTYEVELPPHSRCYERIRELGAENERLRAALQKYHEQAIIKHRASSECLLCGATWPIDEHSDEWHDGYCAAVERGQSKPDSDG